MRRGDLCMLADRGMAAENSAALLDQKTGG
jgi:hypothetical protein